MGRAALATAVAALALAPAAHADGAWTCGASAGWVASGGARTSAPGPSGSPCPVASATPSPASNAAGSVSAGGSLSVDGGAASQTIDTRTPRAVADLKQLTIRSSDGKLELSANKVSDQASAACDAKHAPALAGSGMLGNVMLNGRPIDTSRPYSEPGVGVNGAPLFGKITVTFNEIVRADGSLTRRSLHLVVTDRDGNVVFEAVGAEVGVGFSGRVCDPPPVCPPGTQPQEGRCVEVHVTPLAPPPPPVPPLPAPGTPLLPQPKPNPEKRRCRDTGARVGQVSTRRLAKATLCLMNVERRRHHLRRLRPSRDLTDAAARHARAMVIGRYFAHDEPAGPSFLQRVLRSGYLERYGKWRVGENLGWGWGTGGTPRALVKAWMRSRPHRRNILNRRFRDVGIAVRIGSPRRAAKPQAATYVIDFGGFSHPR
jgi:uncharacterized protein YkwD